MSRWDRRDDRGGPPEPGWFELRLVKGGPFVPARIVALADGRLHAEIDGSPFPPADDPGTDPHLLRIWHSGRRSTEADCKFLAAVKAWAVQHQPSHPLLHPLQPVDNRLLPPVVP